MKVFKFGGSSVASATNISRVLDIVESELAQDRLILVSSAISGCTDSLIEAGRLAAEGDASCKGVVDKLHKRHDVIISRLFTGSEREAVKSNLASVFSELANFVSTILAKKSITEEEKQQIQTYGEIFSTKILAYKLNSEAFDALWLDSRDLILVMDGKVDQKLSYARIMKAVESAPSVKVFVAPGFIARDAEGRPTTLGRGGSDYSAALYAAAVNASSLQIWTDVPGIMTTNPKVVSAARTVPRMSYATALCMAEHGAKVLYAPTVAPAMEVGIAINIKNSFDPANPGTVIEDKEAPSICEWMGLSNMSNGEDETLCIVAEGPFDSDLAEKRAVRALREAGIVPTGCTSGDNHILIDVRSAVSKQACAALHHEFFEYAKKSSVDVYIAGHGAVGRSIEELVADADFVKSGKEIRIRGISSDRNFAAQVLDNAPAHSVFVDCTDSDDIYKLYVPLLNAGINIVSSNRRSLSVPYVEYAAMKQAALRNGCFLRYSTTVGNALPILESIANFTSFGDELVSIEAVVSCTMNQIITAYDGAKSENFASLLLKAQKSGISEQDPRMDLEGKDALRKLLILAREAGYALEADEVQISPMLSKQFFEGSLDDFYRMLQKAEPEFIRKEAELDEAGKRQRFVASLRRDSTAVNGYRAEIRMMEVKEDSPFYWISGTENVIIVRMKYSAPLIIRGAGEGAREAAIGVVNDIIR